MVESGGGNLSCYPIATVSEGPGPRVGHASLLVGNAFIVFGGDTKMDDNDSLDDTLYLLNTCEWILLESPSASRLHFQLPDSGQERRLPDHGRPDATATPSTSWAPKYTSSEVKSKGIFSMISWLST
jgi:hypothetical protein